MIDWLSTCRPLYEKRHELDRLWPQVQFFFERRPGVRHLENRDLTVVVYLNDEHAFRDSFSRYNEITPDHIVGFPVVYL